MGIDYRVLQEAAKWFAVLQSGAASAGERQAWSAWLEQPEHARAWAKVERISGQFQPLARVFGAGQERHAPAFEQPDADRSGRRAEARVQHPRLHVLQVGQPVDAGAADDGKRDVGHGQSFSA